MTELTQEQNEVLDYFQEAGELLYKALYERLPATAEIIGELVVESNQLRDDQNLPTPQSWETNEDLVEAISNIARILMFGDGINPDTLDI